MLILVIICHPDASFTKIEVFQNPLVFLSNVISPQRHLGSQLLVLLHTGNKAQQKNTSTVIVRKHNNQNTQYSYGIEGGDSHLAEGLFQRKPHGGLRVRLQRMRTNVQLAIYTNIQVKKDMRKLWSRPLNTSLPAKQLLPADWRALAHPPGRKAFRMPLNLRALSAGAQPGQGPSHSLWTQSYFRKNTKRKTTPPWPFSRRAESSGKLGTMSATVVGWLLPLRKTCSIRADRFNASSTGTGTTYFPF